MTGEESLFAVIRIPERCFLEAVLSDGLNTTVLLLILRKKRLVRDKISPMLFVERDRGALMFLANHDLSGISRSPDAVVFFAEREVIEPDWIKRKRNDRPAKNSSIERVSDRVMANAFCVDAISKCMNRCYACNDLEEDIYIVIDNGESPTSPNCRS